MTTNTGGATHTDPVPLIRDFTITVLAAAADYQQLLDNGHPRHPILDQITAAADTFELAIRELR